MDQMTKIFFLMLIGSIVIGAFLLAGNPRYRTENILKSNAHYYPLTKPLSVEELSTAHEEEELPAAPKEQK